MSVQPRGQFREPDALRIRRWIEENADALRPFAAGVEQRHPALWWSQVMTAVERGVAGGDANAIRVGLKFACDDPKSPFGRIVKQRLLRRLKWIDLRAWREVLPRLRATAAKFDKDDYKPQEYNDLMRLIRRMEEA